MMNDDRHVDRYVRITNRERFLIVRGLSLLANACDDLGVAYDGDEFTERMKELIALSRVFCEENWKKEYPIYLSKIVSIQTMEQKGEKDGVDR